MKNRVPNNLHIRLYGDKTLREVAKPVTEFTDEVINFIEDLVFTMYEKDGVGLAAPQVGRSLRIFVVDPFWFNEGGTKNPLVLVNPEFKEFQGEIESDEGCLSLPKIFEPVQRAERVIIEALNENGKKVRYEADGLFARALQHEFDHLDGILFIDKIPKLRRIFLKKKLHDLQRTTDKNGRNIGEMPL
ncbi:MAG: peptide deformylase [Candidatus Cloacimonas sp. 4484_143]|nr:MAG: peptide deformylase [Candidatus Cloacimonas sp. 4484_143]